MWEIHKCRPGYREPEPPYKTSIDGRSKKNRSTDFFSVILFLLVFTILTAGIFVVLHEIGILSTWCERL